MRLEETAQIVARIVHKDQQYGGYPYTVHLGAVVEIIKRYSDNPYVIAAGWLHDAPEDTFYNLQWINRDFGAQVHSLVECVVGWGKNRKERQADILSKLTTSRSEASIIKTADRIANLLFSVRSENRGLTEMYQREMPSFLEVVEPKITPEMARELINANDRALDFLLHLSAVGGN